MGRRNYKIIKHSSPLRDIFASPGEISDLKDEMEEWRDNMEANDMTQLPKYEEVDECASTLDDAWNELEHALSAVENALEDDKPLGEYGGIEAAFTTMQPYKGRGYPRWMRMANSCDPITVAVDALRTAFEDLDEPDEPAEDASDEEKAAYAKWAAADELSNTLDEIEGYVSDLGGVEFPGMF